MKKTTLMAVIAMGLLNISGCSGGETTLEKKAATDTSASAVSVDSKAATVSVILIGDKRCTLPNCDTRRPMNSLKALISDLAVTELDWSSPEGKAAYAEYGVKTLPAIIFDQTLQSQTDAMQRLGRFLRPTKKAGYQFLEIRATHDPTKEICDNSVDDTNNGKTDCEDEDCKAALICRPEIKGDLKLFVMSQCPFGVKALDAMNEVLKAFDKELTFDVHFIASESDGQFQSLHGQPEVDEDIRELCAKKLAPTNYKWMEYIWCRNKDIRSTDYEKCVKMAGISPAVFSECASGEEGKRLLRDDIALGQSLDISASPSWLVNNKIKFSGLDPKTIQTAICQANPGLNGCKAELSGPPAKGGGGGGCGCGGGGSCGG